MEVKSGDPRGHEIRLLRPVHLSVTILLVITNRLGERPILCAVYFRI